MYDEDLSTRNDLIGSTMLTLENMCSLANSGTGVELYRKGKYRGTLFVTQCELELPIDMVGQDGKPGYVAAYPPRKIGMSMSLPTYWSTKGPFPPPVSYPNPCHPYEAPHNINVRTSRMPENYQSNFNAPSAQASGSITQVSNESIVPVQPEQRKRSNTSPAHGRRSGLQHQVIRKVSQTASKVGLGSIGEGLEKLGEEADFGSFGTLVNKLTKSKKGWSLGDQLDRLVKK